MKRAILILVGLLVFAGLYVQQADSIPSNARITFVPEENVWLPETPNAIAGYCKERGDDRCARVRKVRGTWADIEKRTYGDPRLPASIADENWIDGESRPVIARMLFGSKKRWNTDGSWNY